MGEDSALLESGLKNRRAETLLLLLTSFLTGRPGTTCALSRHLNEETESRRNTRLFKSVGNKPLAEMKASPQKAGLTP